MPYACQIVRKQRSWIEVLGISVQTSQIIRVDPTDLLDPDGGVPKATGRHPAGSRMLNSPRSRTRDLSQFSTRDLSQFRPGPQSRDLSQFRPGPGGPGPGARAWWSGMKLLRSRMVSRLQPSLPESTFPRVAWFHHIYRTELKVGIDRI